MGYRRAHLASGAVDILLALIATLLVESTHQGLRALAVVLASGRLQWLTGISLSGGDTPFTIGAVARLCARLDTVPLHALEQILAVASQEALGSGRHLAGTAAASQDQPSDQNQ
jgi:hypothetical protein